MAEEQVPMATLAKVSTVAEQMRRRAESAEAERDHYRIALERIEADASTGFADARELGILAQEALDG